MLNRAKLGADEKEEVVLVWMNIDLPTTSPLLDRGAHPGQQGRIQHRLRGGGARTT